MHPAVRSVVLLTSGDAISRLFANGLDGLDLDFSKTDRLFQEPAATTPVTATGQSIGYARDNHSASVFNNATQATAGFKPKYQAEGGKFDATDDYLATSYLAQAEANCIVALVTVPLTLASTDIIVGASGTSANRFYLALTSSGILSGGVGAQSATFIKATNDIRGKTLVVGLSIDGATVRLYEDAEAVYSGAQNNTPTTVQPVYVGALNNNGAASTFSSVAIKRLLVARKALTLSAYLAIRAQILAGG